MPKSQTYEISTHAPHAGSDIDAEAYTGFLDEFQLTLPMRGAIGASPPTATGLPISTHAPHAGSDTV